MDIEGKLACAELVQAWGFARDQARWDDLAAIFHPDGEIAVSCRMAGERLMWPSWCARPSTVSPPI